MWKYKIWRKKIIKNKLKKCKEIKSLPQFYNPYIFETQCRRPYIFQAMNSVGSNNLSFKYQRFTPLGCKDIEVGKI